MVVTVPFSGKSGRPTIVTSHRGKEIPSEETRMNGRERQSEKGERDGERLRIRGDYLFRYLHLLHGALETNCVNYSEYKLVCRT